MINDRLRQMGEHYLNTPIPGELDFVVRRALRTSRKQKHFRQIRVAVAAMVAGLALVAVGVNSNPVFAKTLAQVPVVGNIIKVLTFHRFVVKDGHFEADISVPKIEGLGNGDLEGSLNDKYLAENKKLYEEFMATKDEWGSESEGHLGVSSGYEVVTDNEVLLVVQRYQLTVMGSSDTKVKYDTIDKNKQVLITLPSLFIDDSYIERISENIVDQMKEQMQADEGKIYWVTEQEYVEPFQQIAKDQSFYINAQGKLVICFDKYEVAPGYMGVVTFEIPTLAISDLLVGTDYIN